MTSPAEKIFCGAPAKAKKRANGAAARLFILLLFPVDRYSETYGLTDFEYCLLAALLGPNRSSLAGNGYGEQKAP